VVNAALKTANDANIVAADLGLNAASLRRGCGLRAEIFRTAPLKSSEARVLADASLAHLVLLDRVSR
jgi:hypothetical protein